MIRPDIPHFIPTSRVELLLFLLDSSTSMASTQTYDRKTKSEHLLYIVRGLLQRFSRSTKSNAFRISFIYFSDIIKVVKFNDVPYFSVYNAINLVKEPLIVIPGGATALGWALRDARKILDLFSKDPGLPDEKTVTIFLFTDGRENILSKKQLLSEGIHVKSHPLSPSIVTVSLGADADKETLMELASRPSDMQIRSLDMANLLKYLPNKNKLFLEGHVGDELTKKRIEILRNFVETLSETVS